MVAQVFPCYTSSFLQRLIIRLTLVARSETALMLFNADTFNCRLYSLLLLVHPRGGDNADVREPGGEVKK